MRRRILFAAAAVLALAITSGCETAKNPANDVTPPDVELKGYNSSSTAIVTPQAGPVSSNYTTLVKLTFDAHGSDPGGVQRISINGNYTVTCGQVTQSESSPSSAADSPWRTQPYLIGRDSNHCARDTFLL
jgi:hypothetical protein